MNKDTKRKLFIYLDIIWIFITSVVNLFFIIRISIIGWPEWYWVLGMVAAWIITLLIPIFVLIHDIKKLSENEPIIFDQVQHPVDWVNSNKFVIGKLGSGKVFAIEEIIKSGENLFESYEDWDVIEGNIPTEEQEQKGDYSTCECCGKHVINTSSVDWKDEHFDRVGIYVSEEFFQGCDSYSFCWECWYFIERASGIIYEE